MRHLLLNTIFILLPLFFQAQAGLLDPTYAQQGSYIFRPDTQTVCYGGKMDSNGRMIVHGWMEIPNNPGSVRYPMLARLNEDGNPDASFGVGGYMDAAQFAPLESFPYFGALGLLSSGQCIALAYDNFDNHQVFRFNEDGTLDESFPSTPFQLHRAEFYRSVIDSQGRLVVSCFYFPDDNIYQYYGNSAVMRFTADGNLDSSFGTNGMVLLGNLENDERCYDVAIDESDNIYVAGYWSQTLGGGASSARIYGLSSNGALRADFGTNGIFELITPSVYNSFTGVCTTNNGDVLAAGTRYSAQSFTLQGLVARVTMNGESIGAFGTDGIHLSDDTDAEYKYIRELEDQTIAVAVRVNNGGLGRDVRVSLISANGQPVSSFGANGHSATFNIGNGDDNPYGIFEDGTGRLLIAGYGDSYIENPNLGIQFGYKGFVACYAHEYMISVDENKNDAQLVYPNPTQNTLRLKASANALYSITDMTGHRVLQDRYNGSSIDVSRLPSGMYLLITEGGQYRIVKN
jgi:uncharacterized delta-60 repeat protein